MDIALEFPQPDNENQLTRLADDRELSSSPQQENFLQFIKKTNAFSEEIIQPLSNGKGFDYTNLNMILSENANVFTDTFSLSKYNVAVTLNI